MVRIVMKKAQTYYIQILSVCIAKSSKFHTIQIPCENLNLNSQTSVNLNKIANIFVSYLGQLFSLQVNHGFLPIVQGHFSKYLNFLTFSYILPPASFQPFDWIVDVTWRSDIFSYQVDEISYQSPHDTHFDQKHFFLLKIGSKLIALDRKLSPDMNFPGSIYSISRQLHTCYCIISVFGSFLYF